MCFLVMADVSLAYENHYAMKRESTNWKEGRDIWWQVGFHNSSCIHIFIKYVLLLLIMCMLYSLPFIVAFVISLEGRENGMSLVYFNGMPALNIKRFCVQIYTMLLNRLRLLWHILYQLIVIGNYFVGSIMICNVVLGCCS